LVSRTTNVLVVTGWLFRWLDVLHGLFAECREAHGFHH